MKKLLTHVTTYMDIWGISEFKKSQFQMFTYKGFGENGRIESV